MSLPKFKIGDKVQVGKRERSGMEADLESSYQDRDITSKKYDKLAAYLSSGKPFVISGIEKEMAGPIKTRREMYILATDDGVNFCGMHYLIGGTKI